METRTVRLSVPEIARVRGWQYLKTRDHLLSGKLPGKVVIEQLTSKRRRLFLEIELAEEPMLALDAVRGAQ